MRAMYASAWRSFEAWTEARGNLPMPASPPLAAAYLAHLAEECRLSVATIRLHRAALAAIRKTNGHEDPTDHQGVRWVMKGIALAAVRATARARRPGRQESAAKASWRGSVDLALLSLLRDGLLRSSEAAALTWADVELRDNGTALLQVRRSKTDPETEGVVLYIGREAAQSLQSIRPQEELLDLSAPVFGLSTKQIVRRVKAAGLGKGYTGHSGRVGMAQDMGKSGLRSHHFSGRIAERKSRERQVVWRRLFGSVVRPDR